MSEETRPALERLAGRFELLEEIHSGAMSRVFRARDLEHNGSVALKRPARDATRDLERFRLEGTLLAEVEHPGVVRFVSAGGSTFGDAYLATEWLGGRTLAARLLEGALGIAESVALARRAAEALSAAHRKRIVHRDVKPANLMLLAGTDQPKLIDFGIARREKGMGLATHAGFEGGTWAYMSPEQAMGAAELGPRADVFSLGCVLFECITGRPAFPTERSAAIVAKVWHDAPSLSARHSGVPPALAALVKRLLARDPSARPPDGASAAAALGALGKLPDTRAEPLVNQA